MFLGTMNLYLVFTLLEHRSNQDRKIQNGHAPLLKTNTSVISPIQTKFFRMAAVTVATHYLERNVLRFVLHPIWLNVRDGLLNTCLSWALRILRELKNTLLLPSQVPVEKQTSPCLFQLFRGG